MDILLGLPVATVKLFFSAVFLISGWQKISGASDFRKILAGYQLLPSHWLPVASLGIAGSELVLGIALLTPQWSDTALIATASLLLLYMAVMWRSLLAGRSDIDCGCSGAAGPSGINGLLLVRNALLAAAALVASVTPASIGLTVWAWVFALLGAVVLLLLFHACNQLIANHDLKGRLSHHA
tara:strand:+ start:2004 stop:2549 length:546 start_codon:yes stop_codon:yes gene_type:complete